MPMVKRGDMSQRCEEGEWDRHQGWEAEERRRIAAGRAKRGLPPATESEFFIELEDERRIRDGLPLVGDLTPHPNPPPETGGGERKDALKTGGEGESGSIASGVMKGMTLGLL